jgi:hypothetical protein
MKNLLLALLLISPVSFADFNCEVKDMKRLSDDGSLTTLPNPWQVGSVFVVNRMSGEVSGKSAPMLDMTVLYVGDDENAWKGISSRLLKRVIESVNSPSGVVSSAGNGLDALWISTFKKGPNKPFIYYDSTMVSTGICTVF